MKQAIRSLLMSVFVLVGLIGLFASAPANLFAQVADATASAGALLDATTGQPAVVAAPALALTWQQALISVIVPLIVAGLRWLVPKIPSGVLPFIAAVLGGFGELANAWMTNGNANVWLGLALGLAGVGVREATKQVTGAMKAPVVPLG